MKYLPVCVALLLSAASSFASDLSSRVKENAQSCLNAVMRADYPALLRFTHPKVVEMMGDKDKMIEVVTAGMTQMRAQGVEFAGGSVGDSEEPRMVGDLMVAIVPQTIVLKAPTAKITQESSLLGISSDKGSTWTFIDLGPVTPEQFKQLFPELAEVTLPAKKKPVVEKVAAETNPSK